ncbi:MAG: transcriptional repressor NrdR [Aeriscardovia sp.]|nr:transcriptional repressor NrdR [Aeriscardovia sp.]
MLCPFCKYPDTKVVDTRESGNGSLVRRRRMCLKCRRKFTTVESTQLLVYKKDGTFEPFNRGKIATGVLKACKGRPIKYPAIAALAQEVEENIRSRGAGQVSSHEIGLEVLGPLKKLDPVAYLRFASVYENFSTPEDFARAARSLEAK